jgi:putative intracellular protease/amidase
MRGLVILLTLAALFCFGGVIPSQAESPTVLLIVAPTKNHPSEYGITRKVLQANDCQVKVACKGLSAKDMNGKDIRVDMDLRDVQAKNFSAVAVIGGYSVWKYVGDPVVGKLLSDFDMMDKPVGGICAGAYVLGKVGLLKGKRATGPRSRKLLRYGANYVGGSVQIDGNIITARGPSSSKVFGEILAKQVKNVFRSLY